MNISDICKSSIDEDGERGKRGRRSSLDLMKVRWDNGEGGLMSNNPLPVQIGLTIITGPMFCGKSAELIRQIRRLRVAKSNVLMLKPAIDTRSASVSTRDGQSLDCTAFASTHHLADIIGAHPNFMLAIDEAQFVLARELDHWIDLIRDEMTKRLIIVAGLNLDFRGEPFPAIADLLPVATKIQLLSSVCMRCGSDNGVRSHRLQGGDTVVQIGDEEYQAQCLHCFSQSVVTARS